MVKISMTEMERAILQGLLVRKARMGIGERGESNVPLRRDKVGVDSGHTGHVKGNEPHRCCMETEKLLRSCGKYRGKGRQFKKRGAG